MNSAKDSVNNFENAYLHLREKENRLMKDEDIKSLPYLKHGSHVNEWKLRAKTSERFTAFLRKKTSIQCILEIGCGNGWFTHQMSLNTKAVVFGTDVNKLELKQAHDFFANEKTQFREFNLVGSNIRLLWKDALPDIIVFNASIQYFHNLSNVLSTALEFIKNNGEIHILDSPFYSGNELEPAQKRSAHYFEKMNVPEMKNHYFHHSKDDLAKFNPKFLYTSPLFPFNKVIKDSPFPWVCITKTNE